MAISQRCYSDEYVKLSTGPTITSSMTENGNPYENALAKRMNRTPKEEFGLRRQLPTWQQAFGLVLEAVELYNNRRPHWSPKMQTP